VVVDREQELKSASKAVALSLELDLKTARKQRENSKKIVRKQLAGTSLSD
jgi:hypothetical protein